jgi:hypothetical protein
VICEARGWPSSRGRRWSSKRADRVHDLDVLLLGIAADVVGLTDAALCQHGADRRTVIANEQPVADLLAIAIDRQRLAGSALAIISGMSFSGKWYGP